MGRWMHVLGGMLIWTLHFAGLYALASIDAITPAADAGLWRLGGLVFSLACILGCLAILWRTVRRPAQDDPAAALLDWLAAMGAGTAAVAVVWQTLTVALP
jgi:hypothetical protein